MPRNQEVEAETDRVAGDEQERPSVSADSGELLAAQQCEIEREKGRSGKRREKRERGGVRCARECKEGGGMEENPRGDRTIDDLPFGEEGP